MAGKNHIRVVIDNGTHRDFDLSRVFTESDIKSLLTSVLIFVKTGEREGHKIHSWYEVEEGQRGDSVPAKP
jgi:hypothetical protein